MTLNPGEQTTVSVKFTMHQGMGGPHRFTINLKSNDQVAPSTALTVVANYPKP